MSESSDAPIFLRNAWYVAAWASELGAGVLLRRQLLGDYYVFFRDGGGTVRALLDRCPHRFAPLSGGKLIDDASSIQCPYHGLVFDGTGQCVKNPHGDGRVPKRAAVPTLPIVERHSALWAWMGDPQEADPAPIPEFDFLDPDGNAVACDMIRIDAPYELGTDNIMDLSHIEYVHPLFSSSGVSGGEYQISRDGETVWSRRYIAGDELPPFLQDAFGIPPGRKADRWLNVRWDVPACMALWTGGVESGRSRDEGREVVGAHMFTPATVTSTHYFFATSFPRSLGPEAERLAADSLSVATGPKGVFTAEDKPIIESQARNMRGREFWSCNPIVLSIDAGAVHARRILASRIKAERSTSARAATAPSI